MNLFDDLRNAVSLCIYADVNCCCLAIAVVVVVAAAAVVVAAADAAKVACLFFCYFFSLWLFSSKLHLLDPFLLEGFFHRLLLRI